jgi:hypothetical protein
MKNIKSKFKSSKAQIIALIISVLIMLFGFLGYQFFGVSAFPKDSEQERRAVTNVEEISLDMSEDEVQNAIHHMSHQKVKADKKWGELQITPERIEQLLEVVTANESKFDHSSMYLEILNRWKDNDFSSAVTDHNKMWKLQDGSIGKARRLLTQAEEQKYIDKNFD